MSILQIAGVRRDSFQINQALSTIDEMTKSCTVTSLLLDHFASLRRWNIYTLASLLSQISVTPGTIEPSRLLLAKPSIRSRVMLFPGTPSILYGSRDCTSVPLFLTISCFSSNCTPADTSAVKALPLASIMPAAKRLFFVRLLIDRLHFHYHRLVESISLHHSAAIPFLLLDAAADDQHAGNQPG